jgi:ABC-type uncharacterized transport system permease subunit
MYLLWLRVAVILYAGASIAAFPAVLYGRPGWRRLCLPLAVAAFFFHFVSLTEMLIAAHHWAPMDMREVQSLLAISVCAVFLLIVAFYRTVSFGIFALPMALLLSLEPAFGLEQGSIASPMARSGWLFVHISTILAAYAALFFSLLASLLYLAQERRLKQKSRIGFLTWLPPLDTMDRIASLLLLAGFPCMTVGLLAGSLIAQQSMGAAYFLDPKILLSFGMWVLYLLVLCVQRSTGLRGRRAVYLSSFAILVALSVWAANQFSSVHRFTRL